MAGRELNAADEPIRSVDRLPARSAVAGRRTQGPQAATRGAGRGEAQRSRLDRLSVAVVQSWLNSRLIMISGIVFSCGDFTWMKLMSTPSISVVNCGIAFSFA